MSRVAIIAAGSFPRTEYPKYLISSADVVICCDSALGSAERHGITPDVVIGDLDSVCRRALGRFKGKVVHDPDQETNDLTKAFDYVMREIPDVSSVDILAATGRSEAHTIGNISLLMEYAGRYDLSAIPVQMVSDYSTIFAVCDSCELHVGQGRKFSIFSPDRTLTVKSEGLRWPLDGVVFDNWWKGTLNRASEDSVKLIFNHPSQALIILD